jgi:hypothetical protein
VGVGGGCTGKATAGHGGKRGAGAPGGGKKRSLRGTREERSCCSKSPCGETPSASAQWGEERRDIWGVGGEWGIATSGRQVSGTVQAVVTFPAKVDEGREERRGLS